MNFFSLLPDKLGNFLHKFSQKKKGSIYDKNHNVKFYRALNSFNFLNQNQKKFFSKKILEIGTGYCPTASICFWIIGFKEVITIDLEKKIDNKSFDLLIDWIKSNKKDILKINGINQERLNLLINLNKKTLEEKVELLSHNGFHYKAPFKLPNQEFKLNYFDFIFTYDVLEHVPFEEILKLFQEFKLILSKSGYLIHRINYADHFAKSDKNISKINFLRFNKYFFNLIAGNKFMFMNRLRDCDFEKIFSDLNLEVVQKEQVRDSAIKELIVKKRIKLHKDFLDKNLNSLSTLASTFVLKIK